MIELCVFLEFSILHNGKLWEIYNHRKAVFLIKENQPLLSWKLLYKLLQCANNI